MKVKVKVKVKVNATVKVKADAQVMAKAKVKVEVKVMVKQKVKAKVKANVKHICFLSTLGSARLELPPPWALPLHRTASCTTGGRSLSILWRAAAHCRSCRRPPR